jgi:hypothetical protein
MRNKHTIILAMIKLILGRLRFERRGEIPAALEEIAHGLPQASYCFGARYNQGRSRHGWFFSPSFH